MLSKSLVTLCEHIPHQWDNVGEGLLCLNWDMQTLFIEQFNSARRLFAMDSFANLSTWPALWHEFILFTQAPDHGSKWLVQLPLLFIYSALSSPPPLIRTTTGFPMLRVGHSRTLGGTVDLSCNFLRMPEYLHLNAHKQRAHRDCRPVIHVKVGQRKVDHYGHEELLCAIFR